MSNQVDRYGNPILPGGQNIQIIGDDGVPLPQRQFIQLDDTLLATDNPSSNSTDLSASGAGGITELTGDVTAGPGSGSQAATVVNIPTGATLASKLTATAIVAPSTPAAGKGAIYVDSTSKNLCVKDDAGVVKHGVQTQAGSAGQFIASISDAGVCTLGTPAGSAGATLTGTGDLDFTGLTADASGTEGYEIWFDLNFSAAGQAYFRINADTGNNYNETTLGMALGAPTVPISSNQSGITLIERGPAITGSGYVTGTIHFTKIKTGGRRSGYLTAKVYDANSGSYTHYNESFDWTTTTGQLTQITVKHTGTVSAGRATLYTKTGA